MSKTHRHKKTYYYDEDDKDFLRKAKIKTKPLESYKRISKRELMKRVNEEDEESIYNREW